ncbi:5'/3'-nucleotidase SurE [Streptomyces litchfieldiae]|uniref:5'-nucleotidase n=1 Tax=Streptomyces litchfieldiae TaxID=3075543 RepID=A0ABU2MPQ7_9ACTN|nr:5'/3'-nucleotidase SurE [Streptomyces sp. DSM 44938]MDT0342624.1 5'/3'-nucleotidase SurE [Streptomyces sp. DSM 44938]
MRGTLRRGTAAAAAAVVVSGVLVSGGSVSAATGAEEEAADGPLRILVANDDGYQHPYIRQLRDALTAAGHDAVIVAPADNQSGRGTGANYSQGSTVRAEQAEPGIWSVTGTPGDAVNFGLQHAFPGERPDLVVSGVNPGANVGQTVNHSGTIGATVAAVDAGVPALAISLEPDLTNPDNPMPTLPEAIDFTVRTVDRLAATSRGGALLPAGTGLNINYPATPDGGVAFTNVGVARTFTFAFDPDPDECPTCYTTRLGFDPEAPERIPDADTTAILEDDVSISLLTTDWTAAGWAETAPPPSRGEVERTRERLSRLRP